MNPNTDFVPFSRPSIGPEEERAVLEVLRSGWLTTGNVTAEFEKAFALRTGAKWALAVNSCTAGLHMCIEALGIERDSKVFTSPYTFTATAEVARYLGAHPAFVDITETGFNMDPDLLETAVQNNGQLPSCIIPVHIAGEPCRMDRITRISDNAGIPVVEDSAHAFPVTTPAGMVGTLGTAGVFSFYATKTITTGEGGMVVTDDDDVAERIRVMRLHGINQLAWDRYSGTRRNAWEYDVVAAGYKYNLTDLASAIGLEQLKKADLFKNQRSAAVKRYQVGLEDLDYLEVPQSAVDHAWHLFIIQLDAEKLTVDRDEFIELLREEGIGCSVHFKPLHLMSYYRNTYGLKPEDFPRATQRFSQVISLPLFPGITDEELDRVIRAVRSVGSTTRRRARYAHS